MTSDRPAPRIAPLEPPYQPDIEAELTQWMPPGGMDPLALFRTMAVNRPLAEAMRPLGSHLLSKRAGIDQLARELVIARICARNGCEYEWGVHAVAFGAAVGLSEAQLAATASTHISEALFKPRELALLSLCDDLCDSGAVSDPAWSAVAEHFDDAQMLTLLALAGWYHVISFIANAARVPFEEWAARFPTPTA